MKIGIVAGGPEQAIPKLNDYDDQVDLWIGADLGALYLAEAQLPIAHAIGDFDSVKEEKIAAIRQYANQFKQYPAEKNETDLELAVEKAIQYRPASIYLFGVTAGRLDHELANIQLLYYLLKRGYKGTIIDHRNELTMYSAGEYCISAKANQLISFIPFSEEISGLTLSGFYYPLENKTVRWGSTRCISNQLLSNEGTFSFTNGIIMVIKSTEQDKHK